MSHGSARHLTTSASPSAVGSRRTMTASSRCAGTRQSEQTARPPIARLGSSLPIWEVRGSKGGGALGRREPSLADRAIHLPQLLILRQLRGDQGRAEIAGLRNHGLSRPPTSRHDSNPPGCAARSRRRGCRRAPRLSRTSEAGEFEGRGHPLPLLAA